MNIKGKSNQLYITVESEHAGVRIDSVIASQLADFSRSFLKKLITRNLVCVNGAPIAKPSLLVKEQDKISITIPEIARNDPQFVLENKPDVTLIHEDNDFLIVNKPAGLLVHPPFKDSLSITLVDWLLATRPELTDIGPQDRPGIIHRLDKDTSGLLIIPRNHKAYAQFGEMFRNRTIEKTYHAIVQGHPDRQGIIDLYVGRHPHNPTRMTAFTEQEALRYIKHGHKLRHAVTHYRVIQYFDNHTLLELKPVTGRTHQIRVHLQAIGHPIIGDSIYGTPDKKLIERHALHATNLSFNLNNKSFNFISSLPDDIQTLINSWRK